MASNVDASPESQPGMVEHDLVQLTVNILFDRLPVIPDPNNSTDEHPVKPISPVLRFPVNLRPEDARVVEEAFKTAFIAAVSFQIDNADGSPRYYRLVRTQ